MKKRDVSLFDFRCEEHLFGLQSELRKMTYVHGPYTHFIVQDPKKRNIHKPSVKDRVVHQLLFEYLSSVYEPKFIFDSYASRKNKGTLRAAKKIQSFMKHTPSNGWVMKCDVRKYFANVDHRILLTSLATHVRDTNIFNLLKKVVASFSQEAGKGIPLGNLTSQLFANVYLNELDQYAKNTLHIKQYARYNDDIVVVSDTKSHLMSLRDKILGFCNSRLLLEIPTEKIIIRKCAWGIDFVGFEIFSNRLLVCRKTKQKIIRRIHSLSHRKGLAMRDAASSYLGLLSHTCSHTMKELCKLHLYE